MKIISYRQLQRRLKAHDPRFEFHKEWGKGSHRGIAHPDVDGQRVVITVPVHREGEDIQKQYLSLLAKGFKLPKGFFG